MGNNGKPATAVDCVEIVLTKTCGERIEVNVDTNGLLYIDVESDKQCRMNYAEAWKKVPTDQKKRLQNMLEGLAHSLEKVVEQ